MATQPNLFDAIKIFNYVQTLHKCCSSTGETTYQAAIKKDNMCAKTVKTYFKAESYTRAPNPARRGGPVNAGMAPDFVKAYFAALRYFKRLDPPTNVEDWRAVPLTAVLKEIVYDRRQVPGVPTDGALRAVMLGGGNDDFSKIIKLSKNEPSGFVPYMVNSITGSYTDEYINVMNSKIKKQFNQFGGFKKVSKEVIGSLEDLDRILRDDLAQQVNDSVHKRYYKSYSMTYQTGGALGSQGQAVKEAYDMYCSGTTEQREVFDCIGRFMFYQERAVAGPPPSVTYDFIRPLHGEDPAILPAGFIRFNLSNLKNTVDPALYAAYTAYPGVAAGGIAVTYPAARAIGAGLPKSIPILLCMLPTGLSNYPAVLEVAFRYWYGTLGPAIPIGIPAVNYYDNLDLAHGVGAGAAVSLTGIQGAVTPAVAGLVDQIDLNCQPLDKIISCDDDLYERLVKNDMPEGDDGEYQFANDYDKHFEGPNRNTYRYDDNSKKFIRKKPDGTDEIVDLKDKKKYKEFFNTDDKCFNSYFRTADSKQCCNAMKLLMEGKTEEFMKEVGDANITFDTFDVGFKELNPYSVVKFLEGFKFPKLKEYSPIHGTVTKFPNYRWWVTNVLKTLPELSTQQKATIQAIPSIDAFLDMSVAFVNGNINILNPHIDSIKSSSNIDANLESRNVRRLVIEPYSVRQARWTPLRRTIQGNMMKTNGYFRPVLPFGTLFGGQQFTAHIGGGGDKTNEVVLDDFEIRPTFASHIAEDLKEIISNLKNNNKFLRSKEMTDINKQLNEYAALEIKLYEKILLINKYIKIAYYMNDGERESLSENTIKTKIAEYLEYFKDYSGKDMELKNLGSVLRGMINDKL